MNGDQMRNKKIVASNKDPDSSQRKNAPIPRQDPGQGHSQDADRQHKVRHPRIEK